MNIFILDNDIDKSAQALCDKHVVKMILETAQLLCSPYDPGTAPYKRTHYNHPCAIWTRQNTNNYLYLYRYGKALCQEYTYRYGKIHASEKIIDWCFTNAHLLNLPNSQLTPFAQAMPEEYKRDDAVIAYRLYYLKDKKGIATWNKSRQSPHWWAFRKMMDVTEKLY